MKAVILAGGKGTRLKPYTTILPKPLMPIGDMPILEILLRQMRRAGVDEAVLTVGHLAELLRLFFQDGQRLGLTFATAMRTRHWARPGRCRWLRGWTTPSWWPTATC
jgi:NDP-sugar pyrophosphorylase family protein